MSHIFKQCIPVYNLVNVLDTPWGHFCGKNLRTKILGRKLLSMYFMLLIPYTAMMQIPDEGYGEHYFSISSIFIFEVQSKIL
jgi:hypothetical protein